MKPSLNVQNGNGDPISVPVSGDSCDTSSDVLNLSADRNDSGDKFMFVLKWNKFLLLVFHPRKGAGQKS